mmetsp:Transcript_19893/g.48838  ORF Transcript_19893/g.48838 Transcript_19893/m.48838 type:complete len:290 (+) Transcript_19893:126-995(+)
MSHRRGAPPKEEMMPFTETLEDVESQQTVATENGSIDPMSVDSRKEAKQKRIQEWKDGPFAASMVRTWDEEKSRYQGNMLKELASGNDSMPCICCSAFACSKIGAGRIGNIAVLKQSTEWVEEIEEGEDGQPRTRRFTRPKLDFVIGPYWPMLFFVTFPIIFVVSGLTLVKRIPHTHPGIVLIWLICTVGLIASLSLTAFRDPGILPRYEKPPATADASSWRWSDRTHSYRPRGAFYDPDTGVIVEEFDHTCPWTSTAIGKKNMGSFQCFVGLVFVCLIFDIFLLTNGI